MASALSKWQSDPSNSQLYRVVNADASEDLFHLLSRAYGKDATKLPASSRSSLQSVNPGVSVRTSEEGRRRAFRACKSAPLESQGDKKAEYLPPFPLIISVRISEDTLGARNALNAARRSDRHSDCPGERLENRFEAVVIVIAVEEFDVQVHPAFSPTL